MQHSSTSGAILAPRVWLVCSPFLGMSRLKQPSDVSAKAIAAALAEGFGARRLGWCKDHREPLVVYNDQRKGSDRQSLLDNEAL
eukprot:3720958-Alexandrium_andersonii.AAC.1